MKTYPSSTTPLWRKLWATAREIHPVGAYGDEYDEYIAIATDPDAYLYRKVYGNPALFLPLADFIAAREEGYTFKQLITQVKQRASNIEELTWVKEERAKRGKKAAAGLLDKLKAEAEAEEKRQQRDEDKRKLDPNHPKWLLWTLIIGGLCFLEGNYRIIQSLF
jgi:hypothetical protein